MDQRTQLTTIERKTLMAQVAAQVYPFSYNRFRGMDRTPFGAHSAAIKDSVDAAEKIVAEVMSRE